MAVPLEIAGDYEEAIAGSVFDAALLQRIESVSACPFWMRGSLLAATTATRLAMPEVAEAIRAATARFVQRIPALQQLCFSDGTAFLDDQCMAWLKGAGQQPQAETAQEFVGLREELVSQLESGGVEPVLLRLQAMQADIRAPRELPHHRDRGRSAGARVSWLAQDLCASVARTMQQTMASAWEPEVFKRLQQHAAPDALADQNKD